MFAALLQVHLSDLVVPLDLILCTSLLWLWDPSPPPGKFGFGTNVNIMGWMQI